MNKAIFGMMAFLALAAVCLVPVSLDASGEITTDGDGVYKVSTSETFKIKYDLEEGQEGALTFNAKVANKAGEAQASAISPSTGSLEDGVEKSLTLTVPKTAGEYTIVVEFLLDEVRVGSEEKYTFYAVNPIVLTVNLKADNVTLNLEEFGVYFYIDDEKMDDSYTTITLASNGTGLVTYDWIAHPEPNSTHTFYVKSVGGEGMITGLDEVHVFYANDNDYGGITALAFMLLILLIAAAVWVYRKPVKNFGKPKSRR